MKYLDLLERMLAVWPEADVYWGFGRSNGTYRVFFTDRRVVMARLVQVSDGWMFGFLLAERNLQRRQEQNKKLSTAGLDELLALDRNNAQIPYSDVKEIKPGSSLLGGQCLYITSRSTTRLTPFRQRGVMSYAHPDAIPDPALLIAKTMAVLESVPALDGKLRPRQMLA